MGHLHRLSGSKMVKSELECEVTAGLLDSGRTIANVSHCAALIGAGGVLLSQSMIARLMFLAAVVCWPVACYFSFRVAIDASLFRGLDLEQESVGAALDQALLTCGLLNSVRERTFADRRGGALRLWKRLIAFTAVQVAAVVAGALIQELAK